MNLITIDEEKCKRDRVCAAECPGKLIIFKEKDAYPSMPAGAEPFCINCGHCVTVCPVGAITLNTMGPEECPVIEQGLLPGADQVRHLMLSRRSVRSYKKQPVEHDRLAHLIDTAQYAPTGSNKQQVYWIVVEDPARVTKMAEMVIDWMRLSPTENVEPSYAERMKGLVAAWEKGQDRICRRAPHVVLTHYPENIPSAHTDCIIALTHLDLAAYSDGLGTCWAGYFNNAANAYPSLTAALGLPKGHRCAGALLIGYPQFPYQRIPLRRKPHIVWR
ncbi:MAG: nitroreductase family protein [Syntrophomonadales bacterium]